MLRNIFKKKEIVPPFDYGAAIARLAGLCGQNKTYSLIFPSVYYDLRKGKYVVHFECAMKEYIKDNKFFFSLRREEKLMGENLEDLMEFAITYASYSDAFVRAPMDNLPEGVTMKVKNFTRTPNKQSITYKV